MSVDTKLDIDFTALDQAVGQDPFLWETLSPPATDDDLGPTPKPTRDIAQLKSDLDIFGFCLIADALDQDTRRQMLDRLTEQFAAEVQAKVALPSPTEDARLTNLLTKGEIFQKAVLHPTANALVEHALGPDFLLSTLSSVRTMPGSKAQALHIDQSYIGFPTPVPMVCNTVWMLEDWAEETGATRFVPGSHKWSPERLKTMHEGIGLAGGTGVENPPGTIAAVAPAGTCMVFDGRALHGTGVNKSDDKTRAGVFAYYCRPFLRQFENPFLSIDDETMMALPESIRARLGYRPWFLTGGFEVPGRPAPLDQVRPTQRIGYMAPDR